MSFLRPSPKVVISGSFHRQPEKLELLSKELQVNNCQVLSPISLKFEDLQQKFVKTGHERDFSEHELERFHLRAIAESDLLWLHAPGGYLGLSGAFELGYAVAMGKPVYSKHELEDPNLKNFVRVRYSVFESLADQTS